MATIYETSDGKQFNESDNAMASHQAREHQESLDNSRLGSISGMIGAAIDNRNANARDARLYNLNNQIVRLYNAGEWDAVFNSVNKAIEDTKWDKPITNLCPQVKLMQAVASAKKGDYKSAFKIYWYYFINVTTNKNEWGSDAFSAIKQLFPQLLNAIKEAWEKANGRTMTNEDVQYDLEDYIRPHKSREIPDYNIRKWEVFTGRKMTKEDKTRIIKGKPSSDSGFLGKLFGKKNNPQESQIVTANAEQAKANASPAIRYTPEIQEIIEKAKTKTASKQDLNYLCNEATSFMNGITCPKDEAKAIELYTIAAEAGNKYAKDELAKLK